jgi:hypothetical protein
MDGAKSLIHHGSPETIVDPAPRPGRALAEEMLPAYR